MSSERDLEPETDPTGEHVAAPDDGGEIGLAALLESMAAEGRTARISVGAEGEIHLHEGRLVAAAAETSPDLAALLYAAGYGDLDEVDHAVVDAGRLTDLLERGDENSAASLNRLIHEQTLGALFELSLRSDEIEIDEEEHPLSVVVRMDVGEILAQVAARQEIWRRIAARIPSTAAVFRLAPRLGREERTVTDDEWRYLALLDGRNSVADVVAETGESAFRVCSVLYRLLIEDLLIEA